MTHSLATLSTNMSTLSINHSIIKTSQLIANHAIFKLVNSIKCMVNHYINLRVWTHPVITSRMHIWIVALGSKLANICIWATESNVCVWNPLRQAAATLFSNRWDQAVAATKTEGGALPKGG